MREAFTLRGAERAFGISRTRLSEAIRSGDLPAARIGARRMTILRGDVEGWLRRNAVKPTDRAAARVEQVLAREQQKRAV